MKPKYWVYISSYMNNWKKEWVVVETFLAYKLYKKMGYLVAEGKEDD